MPKLAESVFVIGHLHLRPRNETKSSVSGCLEAVFLLLGGFWSTMAKPRPPPQRDVTETETKFLCFIK